MNEASNATIRLMSTPQQGGKRSTFMMGSYHDACGSSPSSCCVVSELKDKQSIFSHLDPVQGKAEEIARFDGYQAASMLHRTQQLQINLGQPRQRLRIQAIVFFPALSNQTHATPKRAVVASLKDKPGGSKVPRVLWGGFR
jgi:hypothetical protein